jgi:hypothetical protein
VQEIGRGDRGEQVHVLFNNCYRDHAVRKSAADGGAADED